MFIFTNIILISGKVSFVLCDWFMVPKNASNPDDVAAAERALQFVVRFI